jgi:hypothetical protein
MTDGENGGGGPHGARKREELEHAEEVKRAHEVLLEEARKHGPLGYHLHSEIDAGQMTAVVLATTDPELIGEVLTAVHKVG